MSLTRWWNRTRYRLYAPVYDRLARPLEPGRRRAIRRLELGREDRVLLLACGPGTDLPHLPPGCRIAALDLVPRMVRRARRKADSLGLEVEVQVGDARDLPYRAGSFDAVLLHLVLSVVPDPEAVVDETARVLARGGRVSIFDKFGPESGEPSLLRRALNPLARLLFSDLSRRLEPMFAGSGLVIGEREPFLGSLYTVTTARFGPEDDRP